jgi:enamine deaminase RidA (YjgF/YER057c/UK114 family)
MPVANPSTRSGPGAHLRALGLELPTVPKPLGNYVEVSQVGSLLFISGTLPVANGKLAITGRLGDNLSVEQGREAVRLAAMNALAAVQEHVGNLDRVKKLVKLNIYLVATAMAQPPTVMSISSLRCRKNLAARAEKEPRRNTSLPLVTRRASAARCNTTSARGRKSSTPTSASRQLFRLGLGMTAASPSRSR